MYQLRSILCPTDFSEPSAAAVRYAAQFVPRYDASITLMSVDEFEQIPLGYFETDPAERQRRRERGAAFAQERFSAVMKEAGLDPQRTATAVRFGTAYKEIVLEAERGEYSAVILPVTGLGASTPHLIGRTAERVVRLCRVPVITLRPGAGREYTGIRTILVPTDFSEYSNYTIPYAVAVARKHHASLLLLHITDLTVSEEHLAKLRFPDLTDYDDRAGEIPVERFVTRDVEPDNSIVNVAEDRDVDLIIMGTHGARGMRRTQIGNTTEEVVRRTTVPVLSITHPVHRMIFPRRFDEPLAAPLR